MSDWQEMADRVEIAALPGEFTDAATMRDFDRLAGLFTDDGRLAMPEVGVALGSRAEIRANSERLQGLWEFFVQQSHPGVLRLAGDTATGRSYLNELGRLRDGRSHANYAIYHDEYRRTPDGWRFAGRTYEVLYAEDTPLPGAGRRPAPPAW